MTYYLHQIRLWWWLLMWRDACDDVERANARVEELHRRAMRDVMGVA